MKRAIFGLLLSLLLTRLPGLAEAGDIVTEHDVAVPMRDGVVLRADLLRPKEAGTFPVLVYRTPYGKDAALKDYTTFRHAVERGYAVVVEDVRGRYASAGEFRPYQNEGRDGYDTIEWAARQPWSNGAVGTFGLSYPGAVQWLAAVENPPHLKAMVPAMTFSTPQNFFYAGGVWDMSWIEWIWDNIAPDVRVKNNLPGPRTGEEAEAAWEKTGAKMQNTLPLDQLEELRGIAPYYYDWLSHPPDDRWWDWCELRGKYGQTHAAVLNLSGWYDDNYGPEGATTNFAGLLKARAGETDPHTHLLIGPWVHGVASTAKTKSGEREFGPDAAINYDETVLRWMDHYLKGIDNGIEKEKTVRYFVMGDNQWRDAEAWPPPAKSTPYYLVPPKSGEPAGDLWLQAPKAADEFASFVSDPAKPVTNAYASSGAHDYRALAKRADVLVFDSAPVERDIEVSGPIQAVIYLSCDCRDTDLWVRLLDVAPDGTAFNLMSPGLDVLRASYRDLKKGRQLLSPHQVYELHLNNLITSNVFQKGHRIRVQISATFFPNFSRNLQTGESEATSARMQKATISVYSDRKHPSHVILPVVAR
ncbi:MAG TPA: CocE/NonD family hydrolase [Terriglobales bacterium]|jgi:putative CocE/NonD family hydrolase|nr:CocE/NonD family hydrolase [Terriglobales bacterium]